MKHRSSAKIMGSLIGLVKPLAPFMILAILMGVAGFLTAILITLRPSVRRGKRISAVCRTGL